MGTLVNIYLQQRRSARSLHDFLSLSFISFIYLFSIDFFLPFCAPRIQSFPSELPGPSCYSIAVRFVSKKKLISLVHESAFCTPIELFSPLPQRFSRYKRISN